ncbi:MAG: phytanoyl-CoA dioxygenase [Proteobacteria bacterium SG_bin5]|uniref:phytanoyl-CoA dioxygenase family protein n=1 Tax=Sphingomonas sp. SFZ2018-12 TaxID=2683197 RepID=UPI000A0E08E6|nr:phytanoyl-CoA dioxygenase family protein [Sphingomonas sp. SFZ2018-12]MBX9815466.1 phytanoyl-CoA dioxygenase family protein [Sphingomonas sp.]MCH4894062.1 phytanoyl-CoA dioxygenase family protein [Sphingomonas sp. SFZ2018-12]OQW43619.1 MAG: phytanoyl-CoA dioxygenase [Proteobacteria bacterium SG_bin5]
MTDILDLSGEIARHTADLLTDGYCVIPGALPSTTIGALDDDLADDFDRTPFGQGGFYGTTTKRFGRLLVRSPHAAALVQHRLVLGIAEAVLSPWCDRIQLNTTQAIAVHPGAPAQLPHRDQDMWRGPVGEIEYLVNVMWPLTDFTAQNGATLVWPRSHGAKALEPEPEEAWFAAEMTPGAALVLLGSTLHGAGANVTDAVRRGLVVGYSLGWLKPYENQWLAYPPAVARTFPPELAALVGYRQHRPNLGNYEGQCPSVLLGDHVGEPLGAIDALRPDQQALVDAYAEDRRAVP